VDFSSEVTAALRVTDGALVVVDVVDGCSIQTETVLKQALDERIKPVLVINKIDRAILEQKLEPERLYQRLKEIVDKVNHLVYIHSNSREDSSNGQCSEILDPAKGNVAFAAGKDGWGFNLSQFAEKYSNKKSLVNKLWGDNFYNFETNKWETKEDLCKDTKSTRGFNKYILEPIYKALNVCLDNDYETLNVMCKKLGLDVRLSKEQIDNFHGRDLMRFFMKKWLPAAEALLDLIILKLPSPCEAQRYRLEQLYEGPLDDEAAIAMRECDPNSHLMVYVSKMIPSGVSKNKFFAFGRVFSGTASVGQKVRLMGPGYSVGSDNYLYLKNLTRCI
jgi:elongation factor 2